jgi:hypothetical protein
LHNFKGCHGNDQGLGKQEIEEHWQSIHGQRQAIGFLNRLSAKTAGEFINLGRNQLRIITGLLKGQFSLEDIKTGAGRQSWVRKMHTGI